MRKVFVCSLIHNGILGGALYLDQQGVTYRTNKLTVDAKFRNLLLPLQDIDALTWKRMVFPVATFRMKNGEEYLKAPIRITALRAPIATLTSPFKILFHSSNFSPCESALCRTLTLSPNLPTKRLTICGVSEISGTKTIACLPILI